MRYIATNIEAHIDRMTSMSMLTLASARHSNQSVARSKQTSSVPNDFGKQSPIEWHPNLSPAPTRNVTNGRNEFIDGAGIDGPPLQSIEVYFTAIDANRREKTRIVESSFESIASILIKLESLILATNTGRADASDCTTITGKTKC